MNTNKRELFLYSNDSLKDTALLTDINLDGSKSLSLENIYGEIITGLSATKIVVAIQDKDKTIAIIKELLKHKKVTTYVLNSKVLNPVDIPVLKKDIMKAEKGFFWLVNDILDNYDLNNDFEKDSALNELLLLKEYVNNPVDESKLIDLLKNKLGLGKTYIRDMLKRNNKAQETELSHFEAEKCRNFFSYKTFVNEAAIVGDKFYLESIGKDKFFIKVDAYDELSQARYYKYIVKNQHIAGLNRIDYLGDMEIEKSEYISDIPNGLITVKIKGLSEEIKDNRLVENFLEERFGIYKSFIKEWMAVYCYTNYQKLPTLILTGSRGTGKNTFAEAIYEIFPTLSSLVKELEGTFNPNAEQKLIIIDESDSKGKMQYQTLKGISGQNHREINKKYTPQYQVLNNLNVIFLSNNLLPITVEKNELPVDEKNNQFFVYRMPELKGELDNTLRKKIVSRLGHYIRTELKTVFESLDFEGYRYSINVPITEDETKLFNNSISEVESETNRVIDKFESNISSNTWTFYPYAKEGYLPNEFFDDEFGLKKEMKNKVIQELKRRKYLEDIETVRPQVNNQRKYCQKLSKIWADLAKSSTIKKQKSLFADESA